MHFRACGSRRARLGGRLKPGVEERPSVLRRVELGRLAGSTGLEPCFARLLPTAGGFLRVLSPDDQDTCAQVGTSPDPS